MQAGRIKLQEVQAILARHLPIYRTKAPHYQVEMLNNLASLWTGNHETLLDVGGGTGVIAQAIKELLPVDRVHTVDLVDRFCSNLTVSSQKYDGITLPFPDKSFEAATINNVIHHVPVESRSHLFHEIRRVVSGPLYIKDHESRGVIDNLRLAAMDAIGNIPFGGMVWAKYLTWSDWENLAQGAGYLIDDRICGQYRRFPYSAIFPNRLEISMRLLPV